MLTPVRLVLTLLFALLTPGLARALAAALLRAGGEPDLLWSVAAGAALGALLHWALLSRLRWYLTFQHEAKHALVALLFLRKIRLFVARGDRGGMVAHGRGAGGAVGDHAIGLAPYFLLPLTAALALAAPLADGPWERAVRAAFGAALAIELLNLRVDLRRNAHKAEVTLVDGSRARSDIGRRGYLFAAASIAFYGSALLLVAITLMTSGYAGLPEMARVVALGWWDTALWLAAEARAGGAALG